jgi:hypothetical protein
VTYHVAKKYLKTIVSKKYALPAFLVGTVNNAAYRRSRIHTLFERDEIKRCLRLSERSLLRQRGLPGE